MVSVQHSTCRSASATAGYHRQIALHARAREQPCCNGSTCCCSIPCLQGSSRATRHWADASQAILPPVYARGNTPALYDWPPPQPPAMPLECLGPGILEVSLKPQQVKCTLMHLRAPPDFKADGGHKLDVKRRNCGRIGLSPELKWHPASRPKNTDTQDRAPLPSIIC